ncbi:HDL405Wp [Eremothecium sinecaudum]|uniref:Single-stranded DNA-binding protein n=1 Tax=Eremothecium sinecaudum TaxID=45286 RepID=A0A0X8HRW2_9SACH|nr:HDL405Wp [Eremothecium sinecaudum]AMD20339.1 HDL405Wp [Eremothecium sinecaudum]
MLRQVRQLHSTARNLNFAKFSIVGRIGSDFAEHTSPNNVRYLKYSIASQPRKDAPTNWFNLTVFNDNQINFLTQYVRKGALVYVEADATNRMIDRDDGSRGYYLSLVQKDLQLIKNGKHPDGEEGI